MNYDQRTVPKQKINKTIIFTNSAKRKSHNTSAVTNHRSTTSNQKNPQTLYTAPSTSKYSLPERSTISNTLMDNTNASNALSSGPITLANSTINKSTDTFFFNFGEKYAESRDEETNKSRNVTATNKENGLVPNSSAQNADECSNTSFDINTNTEGIITIRPDGNFYIPSGTQNTKETNSRRYTNVFKNYENIDMNFIYPERLEGYFPPFGIQQRFGWVWYCLTCDIEMATFGGLKNHVESGKHGNTSESMRLKLNSYIDFWSAQPIEYKKYQISFNISKGTEILQCSKCFVKVKDNKYIDHMLICKPVKSKKCTKAKKSKAMEDGKVFPVEAGIKNVNVQNVNSEEVNEAAPMVEGHTSDPKKKKENGLVPNLSAQNADECSNTSFDINTNTEGIITIRPDGNFYIPSGTQNAKETNSRRYTNVFKNYEHIDMNFIYPERLEGYFPPFGIQQRLGWVWYCLTCDIKMATFRGLKNHVESGKHGNTSESMRLKLNSYVDFWSAQPNEYKKYQISFNISKGTEILQCSKCFVKVIDNKYIDHMLICKPVKSKKCTEAKKSKAVEDGKVFPVEAGIKSVNVQNVNSEEINEAAPMVEGDTSDPKKKKEKKKKPNPKPRHDIMSQIVSVKWSRIIDGLSTRFDKHYKFFKKLNDDEIQCIPCEMNIDLDIIQIISHLVTKDHHTKCGIHKIFWDYVCQICNVECRSESEFWCHRNLDDNHKEKVQQLSDYRHESLGEYQCYGCKLVIFGDCDGLLKHLDAPVFKRKAASFPIPSQLDQAILDMFNNRDGIESIALGLLNETKEAKKLDYQVTEIIQDLENTLRKSFPNVKAYPFGSRITGTCTKASDLDVYVDIDSNYYGDKTGHQTRIIQDMKHLLANKRQTWDDIYTIPAARTPIIRLRHVSTDIDIDLSFKNGLSVENTKFIRWCIDMQPKLCSLILLLKLWNTMTKFKPHLTTYAMCMMVIFKMQIDGHLIPVSYLYNLNAATKDDDSSIPIEQKVVTGWNIIDYRLTIEQLQAYIIPITCEPFDLLKSFFEYYATFDYNKMICPLMGEVINMDDWFEDNVSILPDEMSVYKNKVHSGLLQHTMYGYRFSATLQDPFDMSHNLTKSIGRSNLLVWKAYCQLTYDYLTKL